MKTLVCLLGQVRYQNITWGPWKKFVLDHLDADLVLCGNVEDDNHFSNFATNIFKPEDQSDMSMIDNLPGHLGNNGGNGNCGRLTMHLRIDLWNGLVEKGLVDKYDSFIISRSDILWNDYHPKLDTDHIWCLNGEFHLGLCDRHMVIPRRFLADALLIGKFEDPPKMFKILNEKFKHGCENGYYQCLFNLESFIYCRFIERGLIEHLGLYPFPMYLSDADGKSKMPGELESDKVVLTWPFKFIHEYMSASNFFNGRAVK
jgi:hypothetical protein